MAKAEFDESIGCVNDFGLFRVPKLNHSGITQTMARHVVEYDPDTGVFTQIRTNSPRYKNSLPRRLCEQDSKGYLQAMLYGIRIKLHVLAVIYMTGVEPDRSKLEVVDHINGDKTDNRWANLRVIPGGENVRNQLQYKSTTASGTTGVYKRGDKFLAHLRIDRKLHHLGTFETLAEAKHARNSALAKHLELIGLHRGRTQNDS